LSAKLVATFDDEGCHVVSVTDSYGSILCSLDRTTLVDTDKYVINVEEAEILQSSSFN
jgi:hypothetical protein